MYKYARGNRKRNQWMKLLTDLVMCLHRFSPDGDIFVLKTSMTYSERPNIS